MRPSSDSTSQRSIQRTKYPRIALLRIGELLTARCSRDEPMTTWLDERLLRRPQKEGSLCRRTRHIQEPSGSHLLREPLLGQALRQQGPEGRIAGPEEESRICSETGREGK